MQYLFTLFLFLPHFVSLGEGNWGGHPRAGEACGYTSKANDVTHVSDVTKQFFFLYSMIFNTDQGIHAC